MMYKKKVSSSPGEVLSQQLALNLESGSSAAAGGGDDVGDACSVSSGGSGSSSSRGGGGGGSRRTVSRDQVPELMRTNSNKRILNQRPLNAPTKKLRMKSLLWVKPSVTRSQLSPSTLAQLFPTLIVNLAALSAGMSLGYSAILLPQLKPYLDHHAGQPAGFSGSSEHRPFTVDDEQGSWIASVFGLGAILGGFASGILGSKFGRRKSLLLLVIPDALGWALAASAQNLPMMIAARLLNGFAAAGYAPSIQVYVAEIAQPHTRGWLSAVTVPTVGTGSLLSYALGAALPWHLVAAFAFLPLVLLVPGLVFLPDSPYWYMQRGQEKKALAVMERFRSSDANALAEMLAISDSLQRPDDEQHFTYRDMVGQMMQRQYRRPFLVLNALFLLMSFSGKHAVCFYAVEIFREASETYNEYLSAIAVGLVKLAGSFLYLPAVRFFSRRSLLCATSSVMGASMVLLGLAVFSHHSGAETGFKHMLGSASWLPLLCVVAFTLADPIGLGSIPFLYSAEFYPTEMRSFLAGVTAGLANLEMFLVVKTFPEVSGAMGGSHGAFWMYGGVCFAAAVFTFLFVPETKGKSLQEIEGYFSHKENMHVTPYVTPSATPADTPSPAKRGMAPYPHMSLQFTL